MSTDRYSSAKVLQETDTRKRYYNGTIFPTIPESDSDVFIISKDSDRLDFLAFQYYGDSTLWWIIAQTNGLNGSFYIPPGTRLRIPADAQMILNLVDTENSAR